MTPAKPLVPRHRTITKYGAPCSAPYVTDADAARLEAIVAAADELSRHTRCYRDLGTAGRHGCKCQPCIDARAYDEARGKVQP